MKAGQNSENRVSFGGMCTVLRLLIVLLTLAGASSAFAQDEGVPPSPASGEVTSYDFEDDLVTGDLMRPDGEMLTVRKRGQRSSLITIRKHFIPEMLKSVEDL